MCKSMFNIIIKLLLIFILSISTSHSFAQNSNCIFFQAVARENFSNPAVARALDVFRIWDSTAEASNIGITSIADQLGNNRNVVFYNTPLTGTVNNFISSIVTGY